MALVPVQAAPSITSEPAQLANLKTAETSEAFEAVFLSQLVDQLMKTAGETAFGGEQSAEMWRSFMSEAVAKQLVQQGGLGLSGPVQDMLNAYKRVMPTQKG